VWKARSWSAGTWDRIDEGICVGIAGELSLEEVRLGRYRFEA